MEKTKEKEVAPTEKVKMRTFLVVENVLAATIDYLIRKPYGEVEGLIEALKLSRVVEEAVKPKMVKPKIVKLKK